MVEVDPVAYAWIATFVLPINSSINPFLYTLASLTFDKMKSSARKSSRRQSRETHLSMSISGLQNQTCRGERVTDRRSDAAF